MIVLTICYFACISCSNKDSVEYSRNSESSEGVVRVVPGESLVFDDASQRVFYISESVPFGGTAAWYFQNGEQQQESAFTEGLEHGQTIWWHEDGSRAGQSTFVKGILNGPLIEWYPGGER